MAGVIKRNMASANECLFTPFLINIHVKLCQLATDESLNLQTKHPSKPASLCQSKKDSGLKQIMMKWSVFRSKTTTLVHHVYSKLIRKMKRTYTTETDVPLSSCHISLCVNNARLQYYNVIYSYIVYTPNNSENAEKYYNSLLVV